MRPTQAESFVRIRAGGFTMIEMVVVMTIIGILGAGIAVFIRQPMQGVMDATRRVALADAADTALRRMRRDIQRALPNSVRVAQSGSTWYVEFLPVLAAGRYCVEADCGSSPLDTVAGNSNLSFVGPVPALNPIPPRSEVAIFNLGTSGADAYASDNTSTLASVGAASVSFANKVFPFSSPSNRFYIIGAPVTYACASGGSLVRMSGYAKQIAQPVSAPAGATSNVLASNVSSCSVDYSQAEVDRTALLYLTLQIALNGESVTLSHAIQVSNAP